jgi:pimeloyl-ACP methyl ester carboxylesterase
MIGSMSLHQQHEAVSTLAPAAPPEGCPPPLRCRQVAENWHAVAEAWTLPGSRFGTHGTQAGSGPALYFLNPFGGCAELFTLLAWLLREQYRCVLMDWQQPVDRRVRLDDFAADVAAVADHLGDRTFAVYGATFGAAVATQLAVHHPDRVTNLILQGAWERRRLSLGERGLAWWYRRSNKPLSTWPSREEFQAANHRVWFPPLDPDRWAWFLEVTGSIPLALMSAEARAIDRVDLAADYARLACPTLVLATEGAGQRSLAVQERIAAQHPAFRHEYLHSTGQHPYLTHPHRIAKLINAHLSGESVGGSCCSSDEVSPSEGGCCSPETPA